MRKNTGISAIGNLHAGADSFAEPLQFLRVDGPGLDNEFFGQFPFLSVFFDSKADINCGNQIGTMLFHQLDSFVIENAPMLDRGYPGANRSFDSLGPVRVSGYFPAPHRGFIDHGFHFFRGKLRRSDRFFLA